jgi:kinesin family protein 11
MEGDLEDIAGRNAGIIPRCLYQLFSRLEGQEELSQEYSFKVSYVELYNEELKDLLSPEDDQRKLRIYDDAKSKGSVRP